MVDNDGVAASSSKAALLGTIDLAASVPNCSVADYYAR